MKEGKAGSPGRNFKAADAHGLGRLCFTTAMGPSRGCVYDNAAAVKCVAIFVVVRLCCHFSSEYYWAGSLF
jgi:hypothetical protein